MEGRWARLSLRALATGAIDYRTTTIHEGASLLREQLVLAELERQLLLQVTQAARGGPRELLDSTLAMHMPWLRQIGKSDIDAGLELYSRLIGGTEDGLSGNTSGDAVGV